MLRNDEPGQLPVSSSLLLLPIGQLGWHPLYASDRVTSPMNSEAMQSVSGFQIAVSPNMKTTKKGEVKEALPEKVAIVIGGIGGQNI